MHARRSLVLLAAAIVGAAALTAMHGDEPLAERVVRLETEKAFPDLSAELAQYPPAVRLAFLDYADDEELVLNARLALMRYPNMAPRVLALYGPADAFRESLRRHGPAVVPPVHYFLEHDLLTLRLRALLTEPPAAPGAAATGETSGDTDDGDAIAPEVRGWYAIAFIREQGHDFLGQFVIDDVGEVSWIQSERFATGTKRFFTSGLTTLETKWQRGDDTSAGDYAWATVDVLMPIAAFKLARAGKLAGRSAQSARTGARLARAGSAAGRIGRTLAVAGSAAGIGYIAMNPGVLNSIGAGIAESLGLPAWAVNGALWFVLLLPALVLLRLVRRWLLRPACRLVALAIALLTWIQRRIGPAAGATASPHRRTHPGPSATPGTGLGQR